ncbi:dTDP-4-amino-4,6-dideoxygalactose transaminase [Ferruginibacter sp.]|nr:dTDP-4-amino-4,6-dideoxygalactose transaminase [Ferruginibacter sp.]
MIFYNKPYITGAEFQCIQDAIKNRHLSGNGPFTQLCQQFFKDTYHFKKCLLTTSCTDALEMCAILLNIQPGDEVIIPSFTFVSTANAFILRGAKIIFAESSNNNPNINEAEIEKLITKKTKAIVVVHYAGVACRMDAIMAIANKHNIFVVEDAAQAIDSFYTNGENKKQALGSIGHLAAFSFHESKNIQCGEGGLLVVNDEQFNSRAEIIWEKGTNRAAFFRGEVDKYNWVDVGSSFLPSEITAAFLFAQLQALNEIQKIRKQKWQLYFYGLKKLAEDGKISVPDIPDYATNNAHLFYIVCKNIAERDALILFLKSKDVQSMFHYPGLHTSPFYLATGEKDCELKNAERFSDCLLRLPLYVELGEEQISIVIRLVHEFYEAKQ